MMVHGIVLSRTEMSADRFCTSVAIHRGGTWEQVRLLDEGSFHPNRDGFAYARQVILAKWVPGRTIRLPEPEVRDPRPTHPEDRVVDLRRIVLGEMAEPATIMAIVRAMTFRSAHALFPRIVRQDNGKVYVPGDRPQDRSIGYVDCRRVTVFPDEFAEIRTRADELLLCKIKSEIFLSKIRSGRVGEHVDYPAGTVRLGLANPSDWEGRFNPPRCYVMLTGTVR